MKWKDLFGEDPKTLNNSEIGSKVPKWKELLTAESENGKWEILTIEEEQRVKIMFVPGDDYNDLPTKVWNVSYDEFQELVDFINRIK